MSQPDDIANRLRSTRADMIGTDDEQHYWDCHDAAREIESLRRDAELGSPTRPGQSCISRKRTLKRWKPS